MNRRVPKGRDQRDRRVRRLVVVMIGVGLAVLVLSFIFDPFSLFDPSPADHSKVRSVAPPETAARVTPIGANPGQWSPVDVARLLRELDDIAENIEDPASASTASLRTWVPRIDAYFHRFGLSRQSTATPSDAVLASTEGIVFVAYLASVYPSIATALEDGEGHRTSLIGADNCLGSLMHIARVNASALHGSWDEADGAAEGPLEGLLHRMAPRRRDWSALRQRLALRRAAVLEELFALETSSIGLYHITYLYTFIVVLRGCEHGMREAYSEVVPRTKQEASVFVESVMIQWCRTTSVPLDEWKRVERIARAQREAARTKSRPAIFGLTWYELDDIAESLRS